MEHIIKQITESANKVDSISLPHLITLQAYATLLSSRAGEKLRKKAKKLRTESERQVIRDLHTAISTLTEATTGRIANGEKNPVNPRTIVSYAVEVFGLTVEQAAKDIDEVIVLIRAAQKRLAQKASQNLA